VLFRDPFDFFFFFLRRTRRSSSVILASVMPCVSSNFSTTLQVTAVNSCTLWATGQGDAIAQSM